MPDSSYDSKNALPMAAIGDYEMVLPFQAVGIKPVVLDAAKREKFGQILEDLARENYAVVFIQEDLFVEFTQKVEAINDAYDTSVLPLPGVLGSTGAGLASIRNSVEKAVGMDIFAER
ncbi:MAG: V-type ATP synthase subunit F [Synergistaceae bacterium]|jgi:V/A-type H+-transporting ATPase subunit F|nr:V-type ATP synthase subunit F [Synergistaceae bacterium]